MSDIQRWQFHPDDAATEARVREEEQAAQTLARAELYSMEEMDERCTQAADESFAAGVKAAREAVAAAVTRGGGHHSASEFSAVVLAAIDALLGESNG